MSQKKIIIASAAVVLAAILYFVLPSNKNGEVRILKTAEVVRGSISKVLESTGIVKPEVGAIVKIGSQSTGVITRMHVRVGDKVEKGQIIALIDDREWLAKKSEAEATLDEVRSSLHLLERVHPLRIREAEAAYREADAEGAYAALNLKRMDSLVKQKIESQDSLDDALKGSDASKNRALSRLATLKRLRAEYDPELAKAREAVKKAEAALESVNVKLSHTRIITPLTGVVSQVTAQEGETVVAGLQVANLITVLDPSRLEMWIYVDETDVGQVRPGMKVEFQVDAYPDAVFKGDVDQIYPEPEIRDNIVYYRALVKLSREDAERLRPEMTTQCRIAVDEKKDVLMLPNTAVKWVGGRKVVFVERGGKAVEVTPELGLSGLDRTEVTAGLEQGDLVGVRIVLPGASGGSAKPGKGMKRP